MANELFIQAPTRELYEKEKENIHPDTVVFIEDKDEIIAKGKVYKAVPQGGTIGQVLTKGEQGPEWKDPEVPDIPEPDLSNLPVATQQANGLMSNDDKIKLDGIFVGARAFNLDNEINSPSGESGLYYRADLNTFLIRMSVNYIGASLTFGNSGIPEGQSITVLLESVDDTEKTFAMIPDKWSTSVKNHTPDEEDLILTVPAKGKGYAELNVVKVKDNNITHYYWRGV